jgi:DNA-directed RNA polymerase
MKIRNCKRFARFLKWLYVVKDWTNIQNIINNEEDQNILKYANLYQDIKFYIPCFIDWRGRIYTKYLTYQGGSLSKSLIITSKKREITTDIGLYGFKIYTAMCYGLTSESNDSKLNWFNNNLKSI